MAGVSKTAMLKARLSDRLLALMKKNGLTQMDLERAIEEADRDKLCEPAHGQGLYHALEIMQSLMPKRDEPLAPCECGCGRLTPDGHLEGAHPEDYRYDER